MSSPSKGCKPTRDECPLGISRRTSPWGADSGEAQAGDTSRRAASVADRVPHLPRVREEPPGFPQNACPCKGQREWPLLYRPSSFCRHVVFFSRLRSWPGHGEEQQSWRTTSKPWSKLAQQSPNTAGDATGWGELWCLIVSSGGQLSPDSVPSALTMKLMCQSHAELSCLPAFQRKP